MPMADEHDTTLPVEFHEVATICAATKVVIGGRAVIGVDDARKLHQGLGVGRDYANWIKDRITKYGFRDGVDYEMFDPPDLANQTGRGGDRRSKVYRLTLDTAKELAMVENNEVGRLIRRYFIWAESRAQQHAALTAKETGGIVKAVLGKALEERMAPVETAMLELAHLVKSQAKQIEDANQRIDGLIVLSDTHRAVVEYVSVKQLLDQAKCLSKGRQGINRRIGHALRIMALTTVPPAALRRCANSNVWLFPTDFAKAFMTRIGNGWVADHNAAVTGQGVLNLAAERKKRGKPDPASTLDHGGPL